MANKGSEPQRQSAERDQISHRKQSPSDKQVHYRNRERVEILGQGGLRSPGPHTLGSGLAQHVHAAISKQKESTQTAIAAGGGARASNPKPEHRQKAGETGAKIIEASKVDFKRGSLAEGNQAIVGLGQGIQQSVKRGGEHGQLRQDASGSPEAEVGQEGPRAGTGTNEAEAEPADDVPDVKKLEFVRNLLSKVEEWKADNPGKSLKADQQIKLGEWLKREHSLLRRLDMLPSSLQQNGTGKVAGPQVVSTPRATGAPEFAKQSPRVQASSNLAAPTSSSPKQPHGTLPARVDPSEASPKQVFTSRQPDHAKAASTKSATSSASPQLSKPQTAKPQAPRSLLQSGASAYSPTKKADPVSQQSLSARKIESAPPPLTMPPVRSAPQPMALTSPTPQPRISLSSNATPAKAPQSFAPKSDGLKVSEVPQEDGQASRTKVVGGGGPWAVLGLDDDLGVSEALRLSQALQVRDSDPFLEAERPPLATERKPAEVSKKAGQPGAAHQVATLSGRKEVLGTSNGLGARVDDVKARLDALAERKGLRWVQEGGKVAVEVRERKGGGMPGEKSAASDEGVKERSAAKGTGCQVGAEGFKPQSSLEVRMLVGSGGTGSIPEPHEKEPKQSSLEEGRVGLEENGPGRAGKALLVEPAGLTRSVEKNGEVLTGVATSPSKGTAVALGIEAWGGQRHFILQAANCVSSVPERKDADDGAAGDSPDSSKENRGERIVSTPGTGGASPGPSEKGQKRGGKVAKGGDDVKGLVQCDECGKLRILRREGLALREELNARDWWTCDMAGGGASCEDPEDAGVDALNFLKPKDGGAGGAKRKLGAFGDENDGNIGDGFKAGSVKKIKLLLSPQKKPKLESKKGKSPVKHKTLVVKHDSKSERQEGGLGKASSDPSKVKAAAAEESASEGGVPRGDSEQHAGSYFVPDGFTLIFTARNTEKSVAINAPGDLRYNMPPGCELPVDAKGRKLTYLQSNIKVEEFLSLNQHHPLVKGLSTNDFFFSGRKFESMLVEAYGAGAQRDKWVFKNDGGVMEVTRAGQVVPPKKLYLPPETTTKKGVSSPAKKRKGLERETEKGVKKLKIGLSSRFSKPLSNGVGLSKRGGQGAIIAAQDGEDAKKKEPRSEGVPKLQKSSRKVIGGEDSSRLPTLPDVHEHGKSADASEKEACPKEVTNFSVEDVEGNMQPVDQLNLVQEDAEGKLKRLVLVGKAQDGGDVEKYVYRWKVSVEPFGIAVKTKKAGEWVFLDVEKAESNYGLILAPLKQRLALLRPLLAIKTLAWTDVKSTMLRSLDAEADLLFLRTWLGKLRSDKNEVSLAMDGYKGYLEAMPLDILDPTDDAYVETTSLDTPFNEDQVAVNEVTAEDEEVARTFLEEPQEATTLGDFVCAICDDGGGDVLLVCDGECMRSFHPRRKDGKDSNCESLGMSEKEVKMYLGDDVPFLCPNCKAFQHQCYICGKLGDSDKQNSAREEYKCEVAGCGHFYHPNCVARYELPGGTLEEIEDREAAIQDSTGFFQCPLHTCDVCKGAEEDLEQDGGALVRCRRCPVAYHVKCLPSDLPTSGDDGEFQRAWGPGVEDVEHPIEQRLCYCRKHSIDKTLLTPKRNHLKLKPRNRAPLAIEVPKRTVASPGRTPLADSAPETPKPSPSKALTPSRPSASDPDLAVAPTPSAKTPPSVSEGLPDAIPPPTPIRSAAKSEVLAPSAEEAEEERQPSNILEVASAAGDASQPASVKTLGVEDELPPPEEVPPALEAAEGLEVIAAVEVDEGPPLETQVAEADDEVGEIVWEGLPNGELEDVTSPEALEVIAKHLGEQIEQAEKAIAMSQVRGVLVTPSIYSAQGDTRSRIMPKSRLEPICNAIEKAKAAVRSGNAETARRICQQGIPGGERQIDDMRRLESVMRVYLAPFLHGSRYTSFGRHFTHPDKLREVVERLHPYIDDGDVIVDFCCGANDFSVILAQKLNELGKTNCEYINFDLITARNDFFFTKKDWFHVTRADLNVEGRRLIIGLNPPFGVNAALANKFIEHALTWKPKLMILIVPPVTRRLDDFGYSLCWEDHVVVSGRSFYLPGSLDKATEANLDQWNKVTPPLYLWSHNAFFDKHMQIAQANGHNSIFDPLQPPAPGTNPAWELQQAQQQAFFHQQQMQALQPQWGPFPGVLQPPPFAPVPGAPPPPGFQPGGYGGPQFEPPPPQLPAGANPLELRMAADQARAAVQAETDAQLQALRRTLDDALAEIQQCQTTRQAWLLRFYELKAENARLKAELEEQGARIRGCKERSQAYFSEGNIPLQIQCDAELIGLQNHWHAVESEINESEANGVPVYETLTGFDGRVKELEARIKEAELEMERVAARQREQLAALEQHAHHFGGPIHIDGGHGHGGRFGGDGGHGHGGGMPPHGGYLHGRPESAYGADRPHLREEHRRERREAGAPYRNNGDRRQRPSSQETGRKNWATRPATRGRGRGPGGGAGRGSGWADHGVDSIGPIERGEPLMPMDGQWRENEVRPDFFGQALPPPPPFVPPEAEFQGFPGAPFEPPRPPFF